MYLFTASQNSLVFSWVTDKYLRFVHRPHWKRSLKRENTVKPRLSESNHSEIMYISSTPARTVAGFVILEAWQESVISNNRCYSVSLFVNIKYPKKSDGRQWKIDHDSLELVPQICQDMNLLVCLIELIIFQLTFVIWF